MDGAKGVGRRGPKRWLGIGVRLLVTLFFLVLLLALNRCALPGQSAGQSENRTPTAEAASARLRVDVQPTGALVIVDGLRTGTSPVSLELPSGEHVVRVELEGHQPVDQRVHLVAGTEAVISVTLSPLSSDVEPTPSPTPSSAPEEEPGLSLPDLGVRHTKIELETGSACDYASTQLGISVSIENAGDADAGTFVVDVNGTRQVMDSGLAAGQTIRLWFEGYRHDGENRVFVDAESQVEERDEENNRLSQRLPIPTLPPTCTARAIALPTNAPTSSALPVIPPSASPPSATTPAPPSATSRAVAAYEDEVTISTYPYAGFTVQAWSEPYHMPYDRLDRVAYEASNPRPAGQTYRSLVLENEYLRLTFLPDLGGRLYEVLYKPTGHRETYRNPVLKPSPWGPPEQGWWLAAGGVEWCLPVAEHGYEWGKPWLAEVQRNGTSAALTLRDTLADDRMRAVITVGLEAGSGFFTIRPRLENPTERPLAVQYWSNALLAPGGRNAPSADLRFVLPDAVTAVTVHSRGDDSLPRYDERLPWPIYNGVDLSRLGNWNRWLGFFEDPAVGGFVAVYDEGYDEGMVRVSPQESTASRGAKVFAFGWQDPIPASNWTDDGSSYVEIHGGPASTFDEPVTLPAGGHLQWTELWYPVAGLGGLRYANSTAALNLISGDHLVEIAVAVTRPWSGQAVLLLDGQERWRRALSLVPGRAFREGVSFGEDAPEEGRVMLRLEDLDGAVAAEYAAKLKLK